MKNVRRRSVSARPAVKTVNTGIVGQNGNAFRKSTSIDFHRCQFPMTAFALPKGSIRRPSGRGPGREARLHVQRGKVDAGLRRTYDRNTRRKRLCKEWPPWPIFCTMMATAAPRPIPATSSGFAHATSARSNRVVIENDDVMVRGAVPGHTPKNNHNGSTTRARSAVCNAKTSGGRRCAGGLFRRLHVMRERGAPLWGHREGIKLLITASPCRVP